MTRTTPDAVDARTRRQSLLFVASNVNYADYYESF